MVDTGRSWTSDEYQRLMDATDGRRSAIPSEQLTIADLPPDPYAGDKDAIRSIIIFAQFYNGYVETARTRVTRDGESRLRSARRGRRASCSMRPSTNSERRSSVGRDPTTARVGGTPRRVRRRTWRGSGSSWGDSASS